jgi:hypothetical protein
MRRPEDPIPARHKHAAISGPISAATKEQERLNLRAFQDAAEVLRDEGHPAFPRWESVFSPLELSGTAPAAMESRTILSVGGDHTVGPLYRSLLRECYRRILGVDVMLMLPGWRDSEGAVREAFVAQSIGIPLWAWHPHPQHRWEMTVHLSLEVRAVGKWG